MACSRADGRRSTKHAAWYAGLASAVKRRKDGNVRRSSHGKFTDVAILTVHQNKVSGKPVYRREPKFSIEGNWLTKDGLSRTMYVNQYLKDHAFNPAVSRIM